VKGLFITFEGTEGSGKSTQIKLAASYLRRCSRKVLLLREPGGTRVSEAIREVILNKHYTEMAPETELLLYLAARAQIVREKIIPALKKGIAVICDRFEDSTLAYQGYGRGMSVKAIEQASRLFAKGNLTPDLTILLDIDPKQGMKRGGRHDRMERQSDKFHRKVRRGFLDLARKNKKRFKVIDARLPIETVAAKIESHIQPCLRKK
jgi:dTMP kinase